jgi:hypothetical protein
MPNYEIEIVIELSRIVVWYRRKKIRITYILGI